MKIKLFICLLILLASYAIQAEFKELISPKEIIGSGIIGINSTRSFTTDVNTLFYKDKEPIDYETFEIIGSGFKTSLTVIDDVNTTVDSGTVNAIELITDLSGPVTSLSPLSVLEQPILITSNTVDLISNNIQEGDFLSLSGFLNKNNSLKSTKIMPHNGVENWKIRGYVSGINSTILYIGNLSIGIGNEQLINCNDGFGSGDLVEVIMAADNNYQSGLTINSIISIECLNLNQLSNEDMLIPSVLQGFVSKKRGLKFWLDDVEVITSSNTVYVNGEKRFINQEVNLEVQGVLNTQTSLFVADSVRFLDTRISITFPVEPEDVVINESVTINGKLYKKTPYTKNSSILNNGLSSPKQVEIEGFIDSDGNAYISRLLNNGRINYQRVSMRGVASNLNKPFFSILNFQVDTSSSVLIATGAGVVDVDAFFALLEQGSQVEILNASYDSYLNQITGGEVLIKIQTSNKQHFQTKEIIGSGIVGGFISGTISSASSPLFDSGFE